MADIIRVSIDIKKKAEETAHLRPLLHADVWTDITRMLTLNSAQSAAGREMHLCPMQFDLADRAIEQWTMPGETIFDPFGGLMTVPYRSILKGRKGIACELSARYFADGAKFCEAAERQMGMPTLFDVEAMRGTGTITTKEP